MSDIIQGDLFDTLIENDETDENKFEEVCPLKIQENVGKRDLECEDSESLISSALELSAAENQELVLLVTEVMAAKATFSEDPQRLSTSFKGLLQQLVTQRYFSYVDCYFAEFITMQKGFPYARDHLAYWLLALFISRAYGLGHTALPHHYLLMPDRWWIENDQKNRKEVIALLLEIVFDIPRHSDPSERDLTLKNSWKQVLSEVTLPLVMTDHGLYLERNYLQEGSIVSFFKMVREMPLTPEENTYVAGRLNHYFGNDISDIDWQKFAAANAILNNISVISGGPGTGKTTTVFKILQTLIDLHYYRARAPMTTSSLTAKPFTILLAAPTGKAAARLSESILGQVRQLQKHVENAELEVQEAVREQLALIPYVGQTLHRLLVIHPFTRKPRYNHYNPLNFDLLVVDEASMIDQQMLVQLIGALPAHGRVIFLGDKDQLASVEAGAIMHELCVSENYSPSHLSKLTQLLQQPLPANRLADPAKPTFNYLSFLKKSYRFSADSALGQLAKIVNNAQAEKLQTQFDTMMTLISKRASSIEQVSDLDEKLAYTPLPMETTALKSLLLNAFKPYVDFLKQGQGIAFAELAFEIFSQLGVLSARRTGINGAIELNDLIRKTLFPQESHREFFHGLPIMITHNSVENNLFNGDIGLILRNETGQLRAYFEGVDSARVFSIHALPKFETAFAMTIHKSQGSEFQKIMLFLGDEPSPFLTKELFYTGITRARESVHIFANEASIKAALSGRVDRFSFIHQRLQESSPS